MKIHSRFFVCAIAIPGILTLGVRTADAGKYFREHLSPSFLERSQEESLPAVVMRAQSPSYDDNSGQSVTQASAETEYYYDSSCCNQGCSDPTCQACQSCEEEGRLDMKYREFNRKAYFSHHRSHKQFLYPICRPYCQPGFGIYDTCWRRIQPNYCACQDQQYLYSQPSAMPQAPAAAPNGQSAPYDNTPPAPYQR